MGHRRLHVNKPEQSGRPKATASQALHLTNPPLPTPHTASPGLIASACLRLGIWQALTACGAWVQPPHGTWATPHPSVQPRPVLSSACALCIHMCIGKQTTGSQSSTILPPPSHLSILPQQARDELARGTQTERRLGEGEDVRMRLPLPTPASRWRFRGDRQ